MPAIVAEGLRLAGIHDAPQKPLIKKGAFLSLSGTGVGSTLAGASLAVDPIKKAADGLDPFSAAPIVQQISMALLTVCAVISLVAAVGVALQHRKGL